jgi:hypothetical protein
MKLPQLSRGAQQDRRAPVRSGQSVYPQTDIWACARCGGKATLCAPVCEVDVTAVACVACLGSAYADCKACFDG